MVHVRPIAEDDAAAWAQMRAALWPEEDAAELASEVDRFFAGGLPEPQAVLVASERGEVVGVAELSIRSRAEDCETDRVGYLEGWFVAPHARRQGVGRALMQAAEQWALAQGCREFASDALIDNEVSARAHLALGFAESAQLRCFRKPLAAAPPNARAAALVRELSLQPHPEGGHFAELFRSATGVRPADERGERPALTTIYYLLAAGEVSRWHRVRSDEVWHFYEGGPLELLVLSHDASRLTRHRLGAVRDGSRPTATVAAGDWQAARPLGDYALVGCTVGPGFDFADFQLARDAVATAAIRAAHPDVASFI